MTATIPHKTKDQFLSQFPAADRNEPAFLQTLRDDARRILNDLAFPSRKDEAWKYTAANGILKGKYTTAGPGHVQGMPVERRPAWRLNGMHHIVLVNGLLSEALSDSSKPDGVNVVPFSRADEGLLRQHLARYADHRHDAFTALNAASFSEGLLVHIPDKATPSGPVHIVHLITGDNTASHPRILLAAGKASSAEVIVSYESAGGAASFTNAVTEADVDEAASLSLIILQNSAGSQINTVAVSQQADSRFSIHTVTLAGDLVRNNLEISLNGERCESGLYGLYLTAGAQHVDNHTLVDHRRPHCRSNELYKGVMAGRSTAVFNGKVFVRPHAQKTNAFQANRNILLSGDASVNSKPELEIYADDVKCSHGSTTGQLDDEALFYLRSRGLGRDSAMKLMVHAFTSEVLENVRNETLRSAIEQRAASHTVFS